MIMQVDVSPEDVATMKTLVSENETSKFINEAVRKAIHNAAYTAKIKKGFKDIEEGRCVTFTDEEWEKLENEYDDIDERLFALNDLLEIKKKYPHIEKF